MTAQQANAPKIKLQEAGRRWRSHAAKATLEQPAGQARSSREQQRDQSAGAGRGVTWDPPSVPTAGSLRGGRTARAPPCSTVWSPGVASSPARQGRKAVGDPCRVQTRQRASLREYWKRDEQAGQGAATWRAGIAARGQRDPCPPQRLCPAVACQPRARALRARGAHRSLLARSWSTSVWGDWDFLCNPLRGLQESCRVNP